MWLLPSSVIWSMNTIDPVPLEAMHANAITLPPPCFTGDVVCFGSWAVPSLLHIVLFPSFWYKLIFVASVQRLLFQNWSGFFRCVLANCNLAFSILEACEWFALCGEPSVFVLVKSSLHGRLGKWYTYFLESRPHFTRCRKWVLLYHGKDPAIINRCCLPWMPDCFCIV